MNAPARPSRPAARTGRPRSAFRLLGFWLAGLMLAIAVGAPVVSPQDPGTQHRDLLFAPPMPIRIVDAAGRLRAPFVYPWRLVDRLERRYELDTSRPVSLRWFSGGKLIALAEADRPLLLLGADSLGRDVWARLAHGARVSLGLAALAVVGALALGATGGALAGYAGGVVDEAVMRISDFVLVLPIIYVVLTLRATLPLVLPASMLFLAMAAVLALVGWPYVARGVRAIVAAERHREYAMAARSLGGSHARVLLRHVLPATAGFLMVQGTLLLPAFMLAEVTLSYIGLGFREPTPSWGTLLAEAANVYVIADFPWLLSPAAAIVSVVLALNLVARAPGGADALTFSLTSGGRAADSTRPRIPDRQAA